MYTCVRRASETCGDIRNQQESDLWFDLSATYSGACGGTPIETISIILAAYNEHKYLVRTIESILESTLKSTLGILRFFHEGGGGWGVF